MLSEMAASRPRGGLFYGWYLSLAGAVLYIVYAGFMGYGFGALLPAILEETGWSRAEASAIYGILGAETGLLAPLFGAIVTRFGTRIPMFLGCLIAGVGLLWMSRMDSLGSYYAAVALAGLGFGVYTFGPLAALANWFDKKRSLAMAIVLTGASLSGLMVPLIYWGVSVYGWRDTVAFAGLVNLLLCAPLSLLFRYRPEPYGYQVDGLTNASAPKTGNASAPPLLTEIKVVLKTPVFWLLVVVTLAYMLGYNGLLPHLLQFFQDVGIPGDTAALSFTLFAVTSTLGRLGGGMLGDRFDKRKVVAGCCLVLGCGTLASAFIAELWHLAFFLLLFAPAYAALTPVLPSLVTDIFGARRFALVYALLLVPTSLVIMTAPGIVGWIYDALGSYQVAFFVAAGFSWLGIPAVLRISKTEFVR